MAADRRASPGRCLPRQVNLVADNRLTRALDAELQALAEPDAPLPWWRHQVATGAFQVIVVYVEGERAGAVLWRLDNHGGRSCFAVCGASGSSARFDLFAAVLPHLERHARRLGCTLFRFHTRRKGLAARGLAMGFGETEYVMLKEIAA